MNDSALRVAAFVMARQLNSGVSSLYDFEKGKQIAFAGDASLTSLQLTDQDAERHYLGFGHGSSLLIRQTEDRTQFTFILRDSRFTGYDFATSQPYLGITRGSLIQIYDCEQHRTVSFRT